MQLLYSCSKGWCSFHFWLLTQFIYPAWKGSSRYRWHQNLYKNTKEGRVRGKVVHCFENVHSDVLYIQFLNIQHQINCHWIMSAATDIRPATGCHGLLWPFRGIRIHKFLGNFPRWGTDLARSLAIFLVEALTWKYHIDHALAKVSSKMFSLRHLAILCR